MGEPAIELKVLPGNEIPKPSASNARAEFYETFKRAADEHDHDFNKKYAEDLNTTLIFAGLFSAVTSAFIVAVQNDLQPDYQEMSFALLKIIANAQLGHIPTGAAADFPVWKGPDSSVVRVQAILYSSLAASLLAAFLAMLGRQWLSRYASVDHGSIIDRGRQRKRKMDGMVNWKFALVMECLPLMLQISLLLLGYALSDYLFFINRVISSVTIGFTSFGLLFYFLIVSAATFSYDCPFQTPIPLIFRYLIRFDDEHKRYLRRIRKRFRRAYSWMKKGRLGWKSGGLGNGSNGHNVLPVANPPDQRSLVFDKVAEWDDHAVDSECIAWMFEMPMDTDSTMVIARFVPEIVWHSGTRASSLERLYDIVLGCFDRSSGDPILKPGFKEKAYLCAKALLHMCIQCKSVGNESENAVFKSISRRYQILGSMGCGGNSDLESTLNIIDRVFGHPGQMSWNNSSLTIQHRAWMAHILLYHAWDVTKDGGPLPDYIKEFILRSLRSATSLPTPIVADCLLIIGLILGINVNPNDLFIVDKGEKVGAQIDGIYKKLAETFRNPNATIDEINRALEAMELITPLSKNNVAQKSYSLFQVVMQAPFALTHSQEKWKASRLSLHGAYKSDNFLPHVGDPQHILTFLGHHFDSITEGGQNQQNPIQDEPIQDALRALAYASVSATTNALKRFNPTEASFVRGISYVYQDDKPFELRKAALFFLPFIGDAWFNAPNPVMEPDQMKRFCANWASVVDTIDHTDDVRKAILEALFRMINSPHWRPHIVPEKWELLGYFTSLPDDFQPLRRCIDNLELTDAISKVKNPAAMTHWLTILWLKYGELIPQVQQRLKAVTREVAQSRRRADLETCFLAVESELKKTEQALTKYSTWSNETAAIVLKEKIENLQQAKGSLGALKRG